MGTTPYTGFRKHSARKMNLGGTWNLASPIDFCRRCANNGIYAHVLAKPHRVELVLETLLESISLAEQVGVCVAASAGFDADDQYKIGLAVHEGVMNAFQYGNQQCREKQIRVVFELFDEKMVIRVLDQGPGFRLEDVPDPRTEENRAGDSGRGVLLMRAFMDEFDVQAARSGGAEIVMAKRYRSLNGTLAT